MAFIICGKVSRRSGAPILLCCRAHLGCVRSLSPQTRMSARTASRSAGLEGIHRSRRIGQARVHQASTMLLVTGLLLFSSAMLEVKPSPVFADVSIGNAGPYRFLVDTGAQGSVIDPKLAAELDLRPEFRVEVVSANNTRLLPALKLETLRVGDKPLHESEIVFEDLSEVRRIDSSIRGVLGFDALVGYDFTLLPRTGRLELTRGRPAGAVTPFHRVEGRIAVAARMGSEVLNLILDSGANHVVLFRMPHAM